MIDDIVTRLREITEPGKWQSMDKWDATAKEAADEIERLRADNEQLLLVYKQLRDLVDQFAEHCQCEHSSATMFILHRAAMKHDIWSGRQAGRND